MKWTAPNKQLDKVVLNALRWAWWCRQKNRSLHLVPVETENVVGALFDSGFYRIGHEARNYEADRRFVQYRLRKLVKAGLIVANSSYGRNTLWWPTRESDPFAIKLMENFREWMAAAKTQPVEEVRWFDNVLDELVPGGAAATRLKCEVIGPNVSRDGALSQPWDIRPEHWRPYYQLTIGTGVFKYVMSLALEAHRLHEGGEGDE